MPRKWTAKEILKFLEFYEQYPCLWDYKNPSYKDQIERHVALNEIIEAMSPYVDDLTTVAAVKMKIRTIRNTYALERHKVVKSTLNGGALTNGKIYEPTVSWYPVADRFLRRIVASRDTITPVCANKELKEKKIETRIETKKETRVSSQGEDHTYVSPGNVKHKICPKLFLKLPNVSNITPKSTPLFRKPIIQDISNKDQYAAFGDNVAATLRSSNRPPMEIAVAQHRINEALFHLQMGHYTSEVEIVSAPSEVEISSAASEDLLLV